MHFRFSCLYWSIMLSLACVSFFCFLWACPVLGTHYEITAITANPGIYYEGIQPVKIRKGGWKVIIYIPKHPWADSAVR